MDDERRSPDLNPFRRVLCPSAVGDAGFALMIIVFLVGTTDLAASGTGDEPDGRQPEAAQTRERLEVLPEVPATANDVRAARAQNSPQLAVDPTNSDVVALANRVDAPDFNCALQMSGDGGRSWVPVDPVRELPEGAQKCYGSDIAFDADGTLYFLFVGLAGAGNQPMGVFLATSDDRGSSFDEPRKVLDGGNYQVRMALDRARERLHLVWLRAKGEPTVGGLPPAPNPIMTKHSDDGGDTFSEPVRVSDPERQRVVAPAVALGPEGAVHVVYYDLQDDARDYRGLEGSVWEGTWSLVSASSHNGGERFDVHALVDDALAPTERVMLIFTMPPPAVAVDDAGRVVAAWDDARQGDEDVFAAHSSDGAASWSEPSSITDDQNARQYLPGLAIGPDGAVHAAFFDRRHDAGSLAHDVYYARSAGIGERFGDDVRLTAESSDVRVGPRYPLPAAEGQVDFGTGIALTARENDVIVAWPDSRHATLGTAQQDIFATAVRHDAGQHSAAGPWTFGAVGVAAVVGVAGWWRWCVRRRREPTRPDPVAAEAGS